MSNEITQRLHEIRVRVEQATPGPWEAHGEGRDDTGESWIMIRGYIHNDGRSYTRVASVETFGFADEETAEASVHGEADAAFIAHARTDVPLLLDSLDSIRDLLLAGVPKGVPMLDHVARTVLEVGRIVGLDPREIGPLDGEVPS